MNNQIFRGRQAWTVLGRLGSGGQGETFRVTLLGNSGVDQYALKRLRQSPEPHQERTPELADRRFRLEVQALQALGDADCPHIVRVLDVDLSPGDGSSPWFVMPLYRAGAMWQRGRTPEYLEPYRGNIDRVLSIAKALAEALRFLHEMTPGYVHRDVKCGNVFFDEIGGEPVLGDFGLVYVTSPRAPAAETPLRDHLGPGLWRPPELRRGGATKKHPGSDMYLLGGIIYEALTQGESLEEIEHVGRHFAHELAAHSIARFTNDPRVAFVNDLLRGLFRRDPDLRLSAASVMELCDEILGWKPGGVAPDAAGLVDEAEEAAAEYRLRSIAMRDEAIRQELQLKCQQVASHFGETSWAPLNHLTKMVNVDLGDTEPREFLTKQYPGAVVIAVRVLVAFETHQERPMFVSYVFVVRTAPDRELLGVFDEDKRWRILGEGPPNRPALVDGMTRAAQTERRRLLEKIAPIIRSLK